MAILDMHPLKRGAPLVHSDFPKWRLVLATFMGVAIGPDATFFPFKYTAPDPVASMVTATCIQVCGDAVNVVTILEDASRIFVGVFEVGTALYKAPFE
jgi:hypothetical protein